MLLPSHELHRVVHATGDGVRAAEHILQWGQQQSCPDPGAFITAMDVLFDDICCIGLPEGIDLDRVGPGLRRQLVVLAHCLPVALANYVKSPAGLLQYFGRANCIGPHFLACCK